MRRDHNVDDLRRILSKDYVNSTIAPPVGTNPESPLPLRGGEPRSGSSQNSQGTFHKVLIRFKDDNDPSDDEETESIIERRKESEISLDDLASEINKN